ncbi:MAG: hypothetical protein IT529_06185 [Burkholderiales bacterium]|nr:hypothetical protein [Burkholderiales bacterium]
MKRYYLSKIKQVTEAGETYWRHALQDYLNQDYQGGEIAVDPQSGVPLHPFLLVLVPAISHAQFAGNPELIALPSVPLDMKVSSIHGPTKVAVKGRIRAMGHAQALVDQVWDNADGFRDVLNYYGRLNNPAFDANAFDVDES